jgi:hypothetical protein
MNANEISSKINARLNRIKIVSRIFRVLLGLYVALIILMALGYLSGFIPIIPGASQISFSPNQTYTAPFHIPVRVIVIAAIRSCLIGFGLFLLNRLFVLFERGSFYTAENVRCIKFLGFITASDWLVKSVLELMAKNISIDFNELFFGLFIVLIAWVMDEGRKIQEEQELTV